MATQITQTIAPFPIAPNSANDNETQFNLKADAWVGQMSPHTTEINEWAVEANALALDLTTRSIQVVADAAQVAADKTFVSNNTAKLAAYSGRNILIDGEVGRINQSEFDGNWDNVGNWGYGYDMWRKVQESTTNIAQVIEEGNYKPNSVYTLSGNGVTTQQETSPASGKWYIGGSDLGEFQLAIPNTATNVQLELGTVATPFEILPYSDQLARVQRYYNRISARSIGGDAFRMGKAGAWMVGLNCVFPTIMRSNPVVSIINESYVDCTSKALRSQKDGFIHVVAANNDGTFSVGSETTMYEFDARQ